MSISFAVNGNQVTFDLGSIIIWIIVGLVAGYLASMVTRRRGTILGDIVIGIIGAFVGGFLLSLIAPIFSFTISPWWLNAIVTAFIGAIVVILIVRALSSGRRRRR